MDESKPVSTAPGRVLEEMMRDRGWTQMDLADILGKPQRSISEIVTGKKAVTPETAKALAAAFGNAAEFWMHLEGAYRLSLAGMPDSEVSRRARLYELAPVKEMEKRGWIRKTDSTVDLERELCWFFGQESLDQEPVVTASRRSSIKELNPSQRAWCFRARYLASAVKAGKFSDKSLDTAIGQLKKLAAWPENARKVSSVLAKAGIRFVVLEPLMKTRIDGAALWIDDNSPVVAVSIRYDRIDSFWHTLGHELSHIRHRDGESIDVDLVGEDRPAPSDHDEVERRADLEAASTWIDQGELQSFIVRVGPLYSRDRINQFANRLKIHPGIIVGQLQYRGELGYQKCRDTLVNIRNAVASEAITDGWGHTVNAVQGASAYESGKEEDKI